MSNNSEENQSSSSMAEETRQMNVAETPDPPSVPQVSTDSNDKATFAKPILPNKDNADSTSGQGTQSVGHVESQPSASVTLSSTVSVFVHIGSHSKSPKKFIPSSPDSGFSIESFDSVSIGDLQYIGREETQSSASVAPTASVMVHFDSLEDLSEPRQYTMPTRKSVNVEDQRTIKSLLERQSVPSNSETRVYGKETREEIVYETPMNKNLSSDEIEMQLSKPAVEESLVRTKEISTDASKKNLIEQLAAENQIQLKEQSQVDKSNVKLKLKKAERRMQLGEQISTESKMLLRKQVASGSKLQQDSASAAANELAAASTESNLQLSPDISSAESDSTSQLPEASSSTQQAPSRYPPRKVKLTADSLPSWKNMTMAEARRGRGMYGGKFRQYGEDSPPKEKRLSAFARDLPEITVQNINRGIRGRRFQKMFPSQTPYRSLTERLFLETMAKVADLTKEKKKKTKKKRRSGYACAEQMDEDSWTSWSSSDDEPKSPKKTLPPSPELQFHLEL